MMDLSVVSTALCAVLSAVGLGGGLYEVRVVDPAWPGNLALIQPRHGGLDRKRFWIAAHATFEVTLLAALVLAWSDPGLRWPLLVALASHGAMRTWSFLDFIPKALAFEQAEPRSMSREDALRWARRSMTRLPLDVVTVAACLTAFMKAAGR